MAAAHSAAQRRSAHVRILLRSVTCAPEASTLMRLASTGRPLRGESSTASLIHSRSGVLAGMSVMVLTTPAPHLRFRTVSSACVRCPSVGFPRILRVLLIASTQRNPLIRASAASRVSRRISRRRRSLECAVAETARLYSARVAHWKSSSCQLKHPRDPSFQGFLDRVTSARPVGFRFLS